MLRDGGNAVDAAIAVAAALVVLEPTSCGLGGDAFALVWEEGHLYGLNASGAAPALADAEALRRDGHKEMPKLGWPSVTVPGVVSGWAALHRRFGSLPFTEVLAPAIHYAREGAPVPPVIAGYWKAAERRFKGMGGVFEEFEEAFLPGGRAPMPGEIFRCEPMAATLESIAFTYGQSFYRGSIAEAIAEHSERPRRPHTPGRPPAPRARMGGAHFSALQGLRHPRDPPERAGHRGPHRPRHPGGLRR